MAVYRYARLLRLGCLLLILAGLQQTTQRSYAQQIVPHGQRGCAPGTVVGGPNLVANGDFAIDPGPGPSIDPAAGFFSALQNRGRNTYPSDGLGGGFSIQEGERIYDAGTGDPDLILGRPFGGDEQRDIPASQTYFYSNPVWPEGAVEILLWRQTVAVAPGVTYNFFAYFDNLLNAELDHTDPVLELRVDGTVAGPAVVVPETPDAWVPVQFSFTTGAGQTEVVLEIYDLAGDQVGDDFAMTQVTLKQCVSGLGVAKDVEPAVNNGDGTYDIEYQITLRNYGVDPAPMTELQVSDDLSQTFAAAAGFSVVRLESATLAVNPSFNGVSDKRLLAGTSELGSQQTATITLVVRVAPGEGPGGEGPFSNSVTASAKVGGIEVTDRSTPGVNPDPDLSGDPKEEGENEPTPVSLKQLLFLTLLAR
jgi:hypothetical protein